MLPLQGSFQDCAFDHDIVWENETNKILVAGNIGRLWSVDISDADWVQAELSGHTKPHDARGCARVNHAHSRYRIGHLAPGFPKGRLDSCSNSYLDLDDRTDCLEIGYLGSEGGQFRPLVDLTRSSVAFLSLKSVLRGMEHFQTAGSPQ